MERKKGVPEFKTIEEERKYWETRGPLEEGHKAKLNRPKSKQKRSSFLAVRLTGEELTRLRDIAAELGIGPSTYARNILIQAMKHERQLNSLQLISSLSPKFKEKAKTLAKDLAIGDPENPAMLIIDGKNEDYLKEFSFLFIKELLAIAGIQYLAPENEDYQKLKEMVMCDRRDII